MTIKTFSPRHSYQREKIIHNPASNYQRKTSVAGVILAGGEGVRLHPLTLSRCKPAIHFGGKYSLIDIPLSHAIYAGCDKIFVITQFLSSSLHHHIFQTYMQGACKPGLIEILTAEQKPSGSSWFQGTADAVRQNMDYLLESSAEYFLILSGDQLYDFDFEEMISFARDKHADVVVASLPVTEEDTARMGVIKINEESGIIDFCEKPKDPLVLERFLHNTSPFKEEAERKGKGYDYLGSMGIYLFKRKALIQLLASDSREDFGKQLIPTQISKGGIYAFIYKGYWEDIGTVKSFYEANMALLGPNPKFSLHKGNKPIFSCRYDLPPAEYTDTCIKRSFICEGAVIEADELSHCILGPRAVVCKGAIIRDSYLMGSDHYISHVNDQGAPSPYHIGENTILFRTIVDKNVRIGNGVRLINEKKLKHFDGNGVYIRDGIIIVARGAVIPDGFVL